MHGAKSLLHSSIKLIRQSLGLWKPAKHNLISYCLYVIRERGMINILGYKLENFFMLNVVGGYQDCGGGAVVLRKYNFPSSPFLPLRICFLWSLLRTITSSIQRKIAVKSKNTIKFTFTESLKHQQKSSVECFCRCCLLMKGTLNSRLKKQSVS